MTEEKKKKKSRKRGISSKAKKKTAVARATIRKGTGKVTINRLWIETVQPKYVYELLREPLDLAKEMANDVDIEVSVKGGGFMGQAIAARAAIAKAILQYKQNEKLREKFLKYDRMLLVDDVRRVETKKPLGTKARKKKQKSKR